MDSVEDMRRLGQEILSGLDQRLSYLRGLRDEIAGLLAAYREERLTMSGELRGDLLREKVQRKEIIGDLLEEFRQERLRVSQEMQAELAVFHQDLEARVAELVAFFVQERRYVAQELQELSRGHEERRAEVMSLLEQFSSARSELREFLDELKLAWQETGRALSNRRH